METTESIHAQPMQGQRKRTHTTGDEMLAYFIIGIIGFAAYSRVNVYLKVVYGFLFPLHWLVGVWFTEVHQSVTAENFWDHQILWAGIGVITCLLLALGS